MCRPSMENTAVSALEELCAKKKTDPPTYEFIEGEDGGYVCKVSLLDICAFGNGRSKRDAKHLGAANLLRKHSWGNDKWQNGTNVNSVDEMTNLNRDMIKELRDYCVSHDMPLPVIEIIQQSGSSNAPQFVACCSVASIKRYGKSDKKKDARQRAVIEMLSVISNDADTVDKPLVSTKGPNISDNFEEDLEAERRLKFKTYRQLTEAGLIEMKAVKLCDRHNYFKCFYPHVKQAALEALNSSEYPTDKDKLNAVLDALKMTPSINELKSNTMEPLLQIELNCDYKPVFIGVESKIYLDILKYFSEMLV